MKIVLSGEPKSTQHIYRSTCRGGFSNTYMTAEGKALKNAYQWEARSQWCHAPLKGGVQLSLTLYFGTKRKCDIDNFNKLALDALTGVLYDDDSQIISLHLLKAYDKSNPRIEIDVVQCMVE